MLEEDKTMKTTRNSIKWNLDGEQEMTFAGKFGAPRVSGSFAGAAQG